MSHDPAPRATPRATGRCRLRKGTLLALAAALALAGVLCYRAWRQPAPLPPEVNLAGVDPEVAAAIQEARDAVTREPRSAATWGQLARRLHAYQFFAEALVCYAEAERLDPHNADWPYLRALILLDGPAPAEALAPLRKAITDDGSRLLPRLRLGEFLLEEGRVEEAAEQFHAVLAIDRADPRAHLRLAQVAALRRDWPGCLEHLDGAVAPPARKVACTLRIRAYEALGETAAAEAQQRLLTELPEDPPWHDPIFHELAGAEFGLAGRNARATERWHDGDARQAISLLEDTVRSYPDSAAAWYQLGRARGTLRQFPASEQALRRTVELAPDKGDGWYYLALTQLEQGKSDDALASFRTAARLKPADADTRCKIGACLAAKGDREGAADAYREALRCQPDHAEALEALVKLRKDRAPKGTNQRR